MKVFLSWSGGRSRRVAELLRDWLPFVINSVEPWLSAEDIAKGARWSADIATQLASASFGIICITPENQNSPWVLFEAGALSKALDNTYVVPYLFDLTPTDLRGPLTQFQAAIANKSETFRVLVGMNSMIKDSPLPEQRLYKAFEQWWPQLEKDLGSIPDLARAKKQERTDRELLEEAVLLLRDLSQRPATVTEVIRRVPGYFLQDPRESAAYSPVFPPYGFVYSGPPKGEDPIGVYRPRISIIGAEDTTKASQKPPEDAPKKS